MQRKALKQLNKVTQWTNEKVFSGERTEFSDDFAEFEQEIEPLKVGVERLYATSQAFYDHLSKLKPSADPYPPSGSGKDKLRVSEALGLVMIDYGNDAGGAYGDALVQYGRARVKIASVQDEFSQRLQDGFIMNTEASLEGVNEYKALRKKMDSRRLTLDSALSRLRTSKKENPALEQEVEVAQTRFEEAEEETQLRMQNIKKQEEEQFAALADWLDAEMEYFASCKEILDDLRANFPSRYEQSSLSGRPRAKSNASARSAGRTPTRPTHTRPADSDDDLEVYSPRMRADIPIKPEGGRQRSKSQSQVDKVSEVRSRSGSKSQGDKDKKEDKDREGRERSDSTASAGKAKGRGIMASIGSIGSFGMKSASSASKSATKAASKAGKSAFGRNAKYGNLSDEERERVALDSDDDPYKREQTPSPIAGRARSQSVASVVSGLSSLAPPDTRRRALTSPPSPAGRWVKVLFDYEGREADELPLRRGQVVEVTSEVSAEWLMGEFGGRSGMFPKSYTEEVVEAKPVIPTRPTIQKQMSLPSRDFRRSMPPVPFGQSPGKGFAAPSDLDSGSEAGEVDDGIATSLASAAQPAPTSNRSRSGSIARKPAPPPPPSRRATGGVGRSRSSTVSRGTPLASDEDNNSHASVSSSGALPPPIRPALSQRSSGQASPSRYASPAASAAKVARSPFEHSDDEDTPIRPLATGLGPMHLRNNTTATQPDCGVCGCGDFTQNVFKSNGVCATCFHQH